MSAFKTTFCKAELSEITYKNFKNFNAESFNQELCNSLASNTIESYESFEKVFFDTFNKYTPIKKKSIRANHVVYVTKTLIKAIIARSSVVSISN